MGLKMLMFVILLAATFLMLFIVYLSYRKKKLEVAKYCAFVMLAASFYSLGYAFEIVSPDLDHAKLWLKVQYIGIPFITPLWLILVIKYTGHQALLKKWVMPLLFAIPILTLGLHYTNEFHHWFYRAIQFDPNRSSLSPTILYKGPWYWVHISYLYFEAAAGIGLFVRMYSKAVPIVRRQVVVLILGAAAPWLSNIISLAGYNRLNIDLTPLGFTLSGLIYIWGIYRFNLLRLVPVALQTVFETMQDGVMILDYENNIMHVNQAARGMFEELNRLTDNMNSIHDVFASQPELLSKIIVPENGASRISVQRGQETRYYHVKFSIIRDKASNILGELLVFIDITQVTLYQEKLLSNARQMAEYHAFKDKLFAVVTHDIRDPLALLVNLTDIMEEESADPEGENFQVFQELSSKIRDTYMQVGNLLDWFHSQKGKASPSPLVWNLEPIVRQSVLVMKTRMDMKNIRITAAVKMDMQVYADKEMVELVIRNLLSNAIKFTGTGGHIHIEATSNEDWVTLSVRDSGVGVDQETGKTLFREVQQISPPGTAGERGSGLGLFLCGKFVPLNGGDIWFANNQDRGSTFSFTLPANEASGTRPGTRQERDAV